MSSNPETINVGQCVIAASFTVEPMQRFVDYLINKLTLPLQTKVAPYHQVFQQLIDPTSDINQNDNGANLFLIRLDDFVRDIADDEKVEKVQQFSKDLAQAFADYSNTAKVQSLVMLLPASPGLDSSLDQVIDAEAKALSAALTGLNGITVLSTDVLMSEEGFSNADYYDAQSDELGHVPYNELGFSKLALIAGRKVHTFKNTAKKVLVLDCDNTIWKGVVGEDGAEGVGLTEGYLAVQQFAVDLQQQGVLICLASKNIEQDVLEVFNTRKDMVLKLEHIVTHRVNWEPKAANLQSLADELNLGIDSFVFLDDNPVECGQMREMQPTVTTLQLPQNDADMIAMLDMMWMFDKLGVTEEDAKRTQMYRENSERQKVESSAKDMTDFLASLELKIVCDTPAEEEWPRVAQLTNRTNQFNFTTVRRNESEVRALAAQDNGYVLKVDVSDRFGDYGLVGDMFAVKEDDVLIIDTFLLSCRVLGRGVEYEMLRTLARLASAEGCQSVKLPYITTPKNEPARAFADSVLLAYKEGDDNEGYYLVPSETLEKTVYIPGSEPEAVKAAKAGKKKKAKAKAHTANAISERYSALVSLSSPESLVNNLLAENQKARQIDTDLVEAETDDEKRMLALWEKVLEIKGLGMHDDYFALGGTSLMAARLFAEIAREFGQQMRLTTIMDESTPAKLLAHMQSSDSTTGRGIVTLKPSTGKRNLFMIHDGDGETLLYMNLANYLPADMGVFGIEPAAEPDIPMAYGSIEAMAEHYASLIKAQQAEGPYYLGGMCAGGLIAHVVADKLTQSGDSVDAVFMLDTATPGANKVFAKIAKDRAGRMQELIGGMKNRNEFLIDRIIKLVSGLVSKVWNTVSWELSNKWNIAYRKFRFKKLGKLIAKGKAWPNYLAPMTVREIYNSAEEVCKLPSTQVNTILVKATSGVGDDHPFSEVYADHDFGWSQYAKELTIVDTKGGHASMLQEPNAEHLSEILLNKIEGS